MGHLLQLNTQSKHSNSNLPHIVLFPFMSKGHTIPLIHFSRLLHTRNALITIFTTPSYSSLTRSLLADDVPATLILLPDLPDTLNLSDMASFLHATSSLRPHFERSLCSLRPVHAIVFGLFMTWVQLSAAKFGIPAFGFNGSSTFSTMVPRHVLQTRVEKTFPVPWWPTLLLHRHDLGELYCNGEPKGALAEFVKESDKRIDECGGIIVNGFYELEPSSVEYIGRELGLRVWCVGPLCLASPKVSIAESPTVWPSKWIEWLDSKWTAGRGVLYVAFGTLVEFSQVRLREIARGLEQSGVNFLWVVRPKDVSLGDGFEERVGERGLLVREWVEQREILVHESVRGFMSHCGWNSVLESICAKVPILAMPVMPEQCWNATMITDGLQIGLRIDEESEDVGREVEKKVKELMEGESGEEASKKVRKLGEAAQKAVHEGGSSCTALDTWLEEITKIK